MGAEGAFVISSFACAGGNLTACAAAAGLLLTMDLAAHALMVAGIALAECLQANSGSPEPIANCEWVIVWISYDNGFTWELLGSIPVCSET
jgi:hypothetical protein